VVEKPIIGVLAVQGDFHAHAKALERIGAKSRLAKKPIDLCGLAGLILPGGESTTFLKFLEQEGFEQAIRGFGRSHPIFGTCAGAILMAEKVENPPQRSLGLIHMTTRRNAYGRQLSSSVSRAEAEPELMEESNGSATLEAVLIRAPQITEVGQEVKTLAKIEGNPVLVRQGHYLACTFHPELSADERVHRYFLRMAIDNVI